MNLSYALLFYIEKSVVALHGLKYRGTSTDIVSPKSKAEVALKWSKLFRHSPGLIIMHELSNDTVLVSG